MAQLPPIRQNQAGNAHIDGETPSYLPTSISQPQQHMPHRWRNSLTSPDIHNQPIAKICHIDGATPSHPDIHKPT